MSSERRPPAGGLARDGGDSGSSDWERIEALLHRAVAMAPEEVGEWLADECVDAPGVKAEVESLLAALAAPPPLLRREHLLDLDQEEPVERAWIGRCIGPYRVIEMLGEGGMGAVFRATREGSDFDQTVALKLVATATPRLARRLRQERKILATLDHPNIARLFDGGATEDGTPFIVMEHVVGQDVLAHCSERGLGIEARLDIFSAICSAVAYAHRNLVVHRDLKPANILITGDGVVKLLDFGIARLLQDDQDEVEPTRGTGHRFLTPECAAPEQILGARITTAVDVYALGVLLYRLLTDQSPYDVAGLAPLQIERRICRDQPPLPSSLELDQATASRRGMSPSRLRRRLRGDLDTIVMTALQKDPQRRYASVAALLDDVQLHLDHQPIRARRDSVLYRASTFLRRHWLGAAAVALVTVSLLGGLLFALAGQRAARRQARKARIVSELLLDLFRLSEPDSSHGRTIDARDLLEQASRQVDLRLTGQPEIQREMLSVIGAAFTSLGLYEEARAHLERSLALGGEDHLPLDGQRARLLLHLAELSRLEGRFSEAQQYLDRVAADSRYPETLSWISAETLNGQGILARESGDLGRARELLGEALAQHRRLDPADEDTLARTMNNLAVVLSRSGDLAQAEQLFRESLDRLRHTRGEPSFLVAGALTNLAVVLRREGRLDAAGPFYRQALKMRRELYPGDHPQIAQSLNNLGTYYYYRGDLAQAESFLAQALEMWSRTLEAPHPDLCRVQLNLATLRAKQGRFDEAVAGYTEALAQQRRMLRPDHPDIGYTLFLLARAERQQQRLRVARQHARQGLELLEAGLGADHARTLKARRLLTDLRATPAP